MIPLIIETEECSYSCHGNRETICSHSQRMCQKSVQGRGKVFVESLRLWKDLPDII